MAIKENVCHFPVPPTMPLSWRTILIIEGEDPFFSCRTVNPESIQSILKTIAVSFVIPTLFLLDEAETTEVIAGISKREQSDEKQPVQLQWEKNYLSPTGTRDYVISSISEVGRRCLSNSIIGIFAPIFESAQEQALPSMSRNGSNDAGWSILKRV